MELYKKYNLTLWEGIGIFLVMLLLIAGTVDSVCYIVSHGITWRRGLRVFIYGLLCWYSGIGYKKPHGNLLKYLFMAYEVFVLATITHILQYAPADMPTQTVIRLLLYCAVAMIVPYMAGRLNRINENKVLGIIVLTCLLAIAILNLIFSQTSGDFLSAINTSVLGLAVLSSYLVRYKQHKEVSLEDKK